MEKFNLLVCFLLISTLLKAQMHHLDFIGAGHDNMITVNSSSNDASKTVDGFAIKNQEQLKDASRFLAQATLGADYSTIEMTAAMGYEAWLEEQFQLPQISILKEMEHQSALLEEFEEDDDIPSVASYWFRTAWATNNLKSPDLLRQRMAFTLSQIFVINDNTDLFEDFGRLLGNFYDMLAYNSFTNYNQLLTDVSLSPSMGLFLSHFDNPKADPEKNIHPDENYAREIMQLFSIGLWQLNSDGSRKYDNNGEFIPTYSNSDIKEFAQVFTGLGSGAQNGAFGSFTEVDDGELIELVLNPMKMYEAYHDRSKKNLLNGLVLPADQPGMEDINQTISHLSNHPNTAPFISKSLIKFLTTSNPSGNYVQDVSGIFNAFANNNMQEIIKGILLHPEARSCNITDEYSFGKLREPVVRIMNFLKAFQISPNEFGLYEFAMECLYNNTGQSPLKAPSVFNFFLPEYSPQGPIGQNYLHAPEFQILNATNAIGLINEIDDKTVKRQYFLDNCEEEIDEEDEEEYEDEEGHLMDYSEALNLVNDTSAFINYLDILLANGGLQDDTKTIIGNAVDQLDSADEKLRMALYLILISPDYAILK